MTCLARDLARISYTVQWAKLLTLHEYALARRGMHEKDSLGWVLEDHNLRIVLQHMNTAGLVIESNGFDIHEIESEAMKLREELCVDGMLLRSAIQDEANQKVAVQDGESSGL